MLCVTNRMKNERVKFQHASPSISNSVGVSQLHLSRLLENDTERFLITSVKGGWRTENKLSLTFEHSRDFNLIQLSYKGPHFHEYFPPGVSFKIKEILLKKSSTQKVPFSFENTYKNVLGTSWDVIRITPKEGSHFNCLLQKAIEDNYTDIVVLLMNFTDTHNTLRQFSLYPYHVYGTPLHRAVAERDIAVIKTLLKCNLDVNLRNGLGWTPLHVAIDSEVAEVVDFLINNGTDVNIPTNNNQVPLHFAAKKNNLKILHSLFRSHAKLNERDNNGQTPLFYAVDTEIVDIVDVFLKNNAHYKLEDKFYRTPFHLAVQRKSLHLIEVFLQHNVDIEILNGLQQTPLFYLSKKSFQPQPKSVNKETYSKIIDLFIKNGANVNFQDYWNRTPLYYAVINDNSECMTALLEYNADINIQHELKENILHLACRCKANKCIQALLNSNIDIDAVNDEKRTVLHMAVETKYLALIEILLKNGANPNLKDESDKTALHLAIESQYSLSIELLLKYNANVNLKDNVGRTALHIASKMTCIEMNIIKFIINHLSDIDAKDNFNRTAVHYAVLKRNDNILKSLLEANADVNIKDFEGKTPLHMTMDPQNNYVPSFECIHFLIDYKADINAVDNNLMSPLHLACLTKNADIIEYLIEYGADPTMRDNDGKNVFHYACMNELNGVLLHFDNIEKRLKNTLNILLKEDISINYVDKHEKTPLHYALEKNNLSFMNELLLNVGADINTACSAFNQLKSFYQQHVIKMKVMKLRVRKRILDKIYKIRHNDYLKWVQYYEDDCKKEIDLMKTTNLDDSKLTYYDFLNKSHHNVMNYTRNQYVVIFMESNEFNSTFPIYGHFLKCHLRKVQRRNYLYDQIEEFLKQSIFEKLPANCMSEIFKHLNNSDLNRFLKAMKPVIPFN